MQLVEVAAVADGDPFEYLLGCIRGLQPCAEEEATVCFRPCAPLQSEQLYRIEEAIKHSKFIAHLDLRGAIGVAAEGLAF